MGMTFTLGRARLITSCRSTARVTLVRNYPLTLRTLSKRVANVATRGVGLRLRIRS